jgi:IS30 family transposase
MATHCHISLEERERMSILLAQGVSFRGIAKILGKVHTTWSREHKRNTLKQGKNKGEYLPCKAQAKADKRSADQHYQAPLKKPLIFLYVREHLRDDGWSPETIRGRLPYDHPGESICIETIYQYIFKPQVKRMYHLEQFLTLKRKKRRQQTGRSVQRYANAGIPALHISERPPEADSRHISGHWETDNMEGKRSDKLCVSATVERKARYTLLGILENKTAAEKTNSVIGGLSTFPKPLLKTLTYDNGKENSYCQLTKSVLGIEVYKTTPYHSWEKGTVENTIGRLRRFLPKGQTLIGLTPEYLQQIQDRMNNTPRKCLKFRTPQEVMNRELRKLARLQVKQTNTDQTVKGGFATLNRQ